MPLARTSMGLWKWQTSPSTAISPSLGGKFPAISLTMVDLPAPLSPMRPTTSPGSKEKLTSLSALMAPKFFDTLRTSSKVKRVLPGRRALLGLLTNYPSGILHSFAGLVERFAGCHTYLSYQ